MAEFAYGLRLASKDVVDSKKLSGRLSQSLVHSVSFLSADSCQSCFRWDKPETVGDTKRD